MNKKRTTIRIDCLKCNYDGDVSSCCGAEADGNRCTLCNKFCSVHPCGDCEGMGYNEFTVGETYEIFVCIHSPEELKRTLYNTKELGDAKSFECELKEIIDDFTVRVEVEGKKNLLTISVDELIKN